MTFVVLHETEHKVVKKKMKIPKLLSGGKQNVPVLLFLDLQASLSEKLVLHCTPTEIIRRKFSTETVKESSSYWSHKDIVVASATSSEEIH